MTGVAAGEGWATCVRGHLHWGRFGAAGLLLVVQRRALLEWRAPRVQHGGTWGIPGGARHAHESAVDTAAREAAEEVSVRPGAYTVRSEHIDDHGGWSYTTVIATSGVEPATAPGPESSAVRWVPLGDVASLVLHPGFAASWPTSERAVLALR